MTKEKRGNGETALTPLTRPAGLFHSRWWEGSTKTSCLYNSVGEDGGVERKSWKQTNFHQSTRPMAWQYRIQHQYERQRGQAARLREDESNTKTHPPRS